MRRLALVCCLVITLFIFAGALHADDAWTLRRCIEYAVENNPDLLAARAKISTSAYNFDYQTKLFSPRLDLNVSTGHLNGASTSPFAVVKGITEEWLKNKSAAGEYKSAALTLNAPIFKEGVLFGENSPSVKMASEQVSVDKYAYEAKKNEIIYNLTSAFFSLLKNNEDIKAAREHLKSLESDYMLALAKFREGLISKNDLLISEVKIASGRKDLQTYRNLSLQIMANLAVTMGLNPSDHEITISNERFSHPEVNSLEHLISKALESRPEIAAQKEMVLMAKENLRLAESLRYPAVDLVSTYTTASDYSSNSSSMWLSVLQLNMPLLDFGAIKAKIKSQEAAVTEAEKALVSLKNAVSQEVVNVYASIDNTRLDIGLKEKILEQTGENARLVREQFKQGIVSISDLLAAESALYDAQKSLSQAGYDLSIYYQQLFKATGEKILALTGQ